MANTIAVGQISLLDLNDITVSPTQPTNTFENMIWADSSSSPYKFYIFKSGKFEPTGPINLEQLDPDAAQQVEDAYNGITDLDSAGKLTRYERSVVRGELAAIVGKALGNTEAMPVLATIDGSGIGQAYAIRKSARDIGIPTSHATYVNFGSAYEGLRVYLSGLSPKAWDIGSSATNTITSATWDAKWNDYYLRYNLLNVEIQTRQKQYADSVGENSVDEAIQAVSNSNQFETEPITANTVVTSPITSVGLPEFSGRHMDSWYIDGKNLLLGSGDPVTTSAYNLKDYDLTETLQEGEQVTVSMKATLGDGKSYFGLYNTGGNVSVGTMRETDLDSDGIYRLTLNWRVGTTSNSFLRVYHMPSSTTAESTIEWIKLERGSVKTNPYTPAPEESIGAFGNRIKPITTPIFSAATSVTLLGKFYGDGTTNDTFYWDSLGRAVKNKNWEDVLLDGSHNWQFHGTSLTGTKGVKISGFFETVVDASVQAVKNNGKFLSTIIQGLSTSDQIIGRNSDSTLFITIANADSGWGESYTPTPEEIKAYFNGWKMCNGTWNTPYNGSGNKAWYPIGDTDLSRSTVVGSGSNATYNPVPPDPSSAISDRTLHYYQLVYRLADPVQEIVDFDGVMSLVKGDNAVTVTYPNGTPEITSGNIKYAINLATVTDTLHYIIPTIMNRVASAEEVITDESIVNTVTNSVAYQFALQSKANASDLGNLATNDSVDQKVQNGLDSIDFSPYVTTSVLDQTARDITAKFSATGGMNLIKNSIGFAELDFWDDYTATKVSTISSIELDTLGFGSGFLFDPDGNNKGITQDVSVVSGQPYTLSWYMRKGTKATSTNSAYRVFVQIQEQDAQGNWVTVADLADNSTMSTVGYLAENFTFTPQKELIRVRFIGFGSVDATITGIMLTIGDVPLQWSLATGEVYNTYIRMDINGIRVSQLDEDRQEIGYTEISPDEFAGYYRGANGSFDKIFYLNGTETVTTRLRAKEEITMGSIKVVRVDSALNTGWAFISNADDPDA
jgi:hypothetical protein